ncbi:NDR1/HIN1-like protein 10 [Aristolochia californica]|uniref:NDR1/HIN1-like protein 10 n=1 Tax=Aristolochia californica TaxID=171875 RepID=UPI0035D61F66
MAEARANGNSSSNDDNNKAPPVTGYPAAQSSYAPYPPYHAHPYTAPPPYPSYPYPPPPQQPYAQSLRRTSLFRRLVAVFIAACVIFGAVTLIVWLVLRPRVPKFSVTAASVTPFNLSGVQLTASWDLTFAVDNPNKKMNIYYDSLKASVFYDDELLAENALAPFFMGKRNSTTLRARLASVSGYVDAGAAKEMTAEMGKGQVKFDAAVMAWVRFRAGDWWTRRRILRVFCEDVTIAFSSPSGPGVLSGKPTVCDVGV